MIRRMFFLCGIVAPLVYVVAVVLGGQMRSGYNHLSMAISELIETGAPNKQLLDGLFIAYNALMLLFAWTVGMSIRGGKAIGTAGAVILAVVAVLGLAMTLFFPMDPRGGPATTTGLLHLILAGALSLGSILAILFITLGTPDHDAFWIYSMISCLLVFLSGAFAAYAASQGSPIMGLAERITIGLFLQWIVGTSVKLVRDDLGR